MPLSYGMTKDKWGIVTSGRNSNQLCDCTEKQTFSLSCKLKDDQLLFMPGDQSCSGDLGQKDKKEKNRDWKASFQFWWPVMLSWPRSKKAKRDGWTESKLSILFVSYGKWSDYDWTNPYISVAIKKKR